MRATRQAVDAGRRKNMEARRPVHTHGIDPSCVESVVDGQLVGACVAQKPKRSTRTNRLAGGPPFTGVTIVIPWQHLVPDNDRHGVIVQKGRPRILLTSRYRAAKDVVWKIMRRAMGDTSMTDQPVTLHAKVWMPDARRRDAQNVSKLICDCLQNCVLVDDSQIEDARWQKMGIDREHPRCEITIHPLTTKHGAAA